MSASVGSFFTDLGDKIHKNANESIDIFGNLALQGATLNENRRQFDAKFKDEHAMNMLALRSAQQDQEWKRRFTNALMGRR